MGDSQESFNLFNPYVRKYAIERFKKKRLTWWYIRTYFNQTLPAIICKIKGHIPYKPYENESKLACRRCREWL